MSRNRAVGCINQVLTVTENFTTQHAFDAYYIAQLPVAVTLDPNAVNNDQVVIQDLTGYAGTTPIVITASARQTVGFGSSVEINVGNGGVRLTYIGALNDWAVEYFSGDGVPSTGSSSLPPRISVIGPSVGTNVPVPTSLSGTAHVINGSTAVTFSTSQTLSQNDLLFFADGTNQPYQLAAAVSGTSGTLTSPYGSSTNAAIGVKTVPAADFLLDPGTLSGLPTTGYTVNVQGNVQWNNASESEAVTLKLYIDGVSPSVSPPDGYTVTVQLPESSGVQVVPFNVDLAVASPSPTSFHVTLMAIDVTTGDTSGTISLGVNSIFMSVTQVK